MITGADMWDLLLAPMFLEVPYINTCFFLSISIAPRLSIIIDSIPYDFHAAQSINMFPQVFIFSFFFPPHQSMLPPDYSNTLLSGASPHNCDIRPSCSARCKLICFPPPYVFISIGFSVYNYSILHSFPPSWTKL